MIMLCKALVAITLALSAPALAQPPHSYGDTLIDGLRASNPDIAGIEIRASGKDGAPIVLTRGDIGTEAETLPLTNSMGETIGTIALQFAHAKHVSAKQVAYAASRRIYIANNLIETDPFVAGAKRSALGQSIVDGIMAANPDLVTLGLHIGASGAKNAILASNFGRIGKPGDKDDAKVIDQGATLKEPTNGGQRLAVSLPMLDRKGRVVGALSTSFMVGAGGQDAAAARAIEIRNVIAKRIPSLASLVR